MNSLRNTSSTTTNGSIDILDRHRRQILIEAEGVLNLDVKNKINNFIFKKYGNSTFSYVDRSRVIVTAYEIKRNTVEGFLHLNSKASTNEIIGYAFTDRVLQHNTKQAATIKAAVSKTLKAYVKSCYPEAYTQFLIRASAQGRSQLNPTTSSTSKSVLSEEDDSESSDDSSRSVAIRIMCNNFSPTMTAPLRSSLNLPIRSSMSLPSLSSSNAPLPPSFNAPLLSSSNASLLSSSSEADSECESDFRSESSFSSETETELRSDVETSDLSLDSSPTVPSCPPLLSGSPAPTITHLQNSEQNIQSALNCLSENFSILNNRGFEAPLLGKILGVIAEHENTFVDPLHIRFFLAGCAFTSTSTSTSTASSEDLNSSSKRQRTGKELI